MIEEIVEGESLLNTDLLNEVEVACGMNVCQKCGTCGNDQSHSDRCTAWDRFQFPI